MASRGKGGGITAQPSRYAILAPDSDSEENENWERVPKKGKNPKGKKQSGRGQPGNEEVIKAGSSKAATKNAKRRAARKRNHGSSSSDCIEGQPVQLQSEDGNFSKWQVKDEILAEKDFEKDLEVALMNSLLEDSKDQMDKPSKEDEGGGDKQKPARSKKGVTLSLQDFHSSDFNPLPTTVTPTNISLPNGHSTAPNFFEHAEESLHKELKKEQSTKRENKISHKKENLQKTISESARVAHLVDELEKKDNTITELRDMNSKLQGELKEVKKRNQILYKMLSKGEISSKSELLQQLEDLSVIKDELTVEVERLHEELEQERSRTKSLKSELQSRGKGSQEKH